MKVAVDTETTGLKWSNGDLPFGVGFAFENGDTNYIDAPVDPFTRIPKWTKEQIEYIKSILSSSSYEKVFANAKFDMHMLENIGIITGGKIYDVLLSARVCNTLDKKIALKPTAQKYLKYPVTDEKDLKDATITARRLGKEKGYMCGRPLFDVPQDYWLVKHFDPNDNKCETYCVHDCRRTLALHYYYTEGLEVLKRKSADDFEQKLLKYIYEVEKNGLYVNREHLNKLLLETNKRIFYFECLFKKRGVENLNSDRQLVKYVQSLGVHLTDRTEPSKTFPDGQLQMNNNILKRHTDVEEVEQLLIYKANCTARGYFNNYIDYLRNDNCILPNLHQKNTTTFRFASSNPNLQNVTSAETNDNPYSVDARCVFKPRPGYKWITIDYSQLELRIFASRGNVTKLVDAFNTGRDPHDETRLSIPFLAAKDPKPGRKIAKNTNFTVINCGGKNVLYKKYGIPYDEGEAAISGFYEAYPQAKKRQKEAERFGKNYGYIYNAYNRKLDVDSNFAYRATSYDIQGSAADLIKRRMMDCMDYLKQWFSNDEARVVLQVHDELVFEIRNDIYDLDLVKSLCKIMEKNEGVFQVETPVTAALVTESWSKKEELCLVL